MLPYPTPIGEFVMAERKWLLENLYLAMVSGRRCQQISILEIQWYILHIVNPEQKRPAHLARGVGNEPEPGVHNLRLGFESVYMILS